MFDVGLHPLLRLTLSMANSLNQADQPDSGNLSSHMKEAIFKIVTLG